MIEHKAAQCFAIKADDQGVAEGIVAVMGNVDDGNDRIWQGAFVKTLAERGLKAKVLDQHNTHSVSCILGHPVEIREVGRDQLPADLLAQYPDATGGLYAKTKFNLDTTAGSDAFAHIKAGEIDQWSIGYEALDVDYSSEMVKGKRCAVRNIRTIKLYEYSPVLWGMNTATTTLSAKGAVPYQGLALAPADTAWDANAAVGRIKDWAGGPDKANVDWAKYRKAFCWVDADNAQDFGAYKLPIADVIGGKLMAVPKAIQAAAGAVQGARGGVDIPDADMDGVKATLGRYYAEMDQQAPWAKDQDSKEMQPTGPVRRMGDQLCAMTYGVMTGMAGDWCSRGKISLDELQQIHSLAGQLVDMVRGSLSADLCDRDPDMGQPSMMDAMMWLSAAPALDTKAGRVLSAANEQVIRSAVAALQKVLSLASGSGSSDADDADKDDDDKDKGKDKAATQGSAPGADMGAGPGATKAAPPTLSDQDRLTIIAIELAEMGV